MKKRKFLLPLLLLLSVCAAFFFNFYRPAPQPAHPANPPATQTVLVGGKDLSRYVGKPIVATDNKSIREWYVANVSSIPQQLDGSLPLKERARQAFELRNKYIREARAAMADRITAEELNKSHPVATFEDFLRLKMQRKHMSEEEALQDIIRTAPITNKNVNKSFGL